MTKQKIHNLLSFAIAAVWLANGLFCKVLNIVPRHQQIVAQILGDKYSRVLTILIGLAEIIMAIWIVTKYKSRLNAITQIIVVTTMNIIEFMLAPDLLLWGRVNLFFALLFVGIVYCNEFILNRKTTLQTI